MKPTRVCAEPGCPEYANGSGMCPHHRQKHRREADRRVGRVRGSKWRSARATVLRTNPWCACKGCEHCGDQPRGSCLEVATEVDHVIPLNEGGASTELANLQGLCHGCHVAKTREEQQRQWNRE